MKGRASAALAALLPLLFVTRARAEDAICFSAAADGQRARHDGRLLAAHDLFITCGRPTCDPKVVERCAAWLAEVDEATPTIIVGARDASGRDLTDVKVFVDGRPFAEASRGVEVRLDPGEHVIRFERAGSRPVDQALVTREREKGRAVVATFEAAAPVSSRPVPPAVYLLGGLAVAGAAVWGVFSIRGIVDRSARGCDSSPGCSSEDATSVRTSLVVGDVAAGVTALAAAAAGVLFVTRPSVASRPASEVGLAPSKGGGMATLRMAF